MKTNIFGRVRSQKDAQATLLFNDTASVQVSQGGAINAVSFIAVRQIEGTLTITSPSVFQVVVNPRVVVTTHKATTIISMKEDHTVDVTSMDGATQVGIDGFKRIKLPAKHWLTINADNTVSEIKEIPVVDPPQDTK